MADNLHCLRNPPALDLDIGQARWPIVRKDDICGSFRYTEKKHLDTDCWPRNAIPIYRDAFGDYCKIPLTRGKFAKVDPEDYLWLAQFRWHCKTNKNANYAVRDIRVAGKYKRIFMHRLIADTPEHLVCDHINHIGLDNRNKNLRNCTISQNNANSRPAKSALSKYKGVTRNKRRQKWVVYIKKDSKQFFLGYFDDEIEAAKAYDHAAKKLHGEYAALNFPSENF